MRTILLIAAFLLLLGSMSVPNAITAPADENRYSAVYLDPHYGGRKNGPNVDNKNKGKEVTLSLARAISLKLQASQVAAFLSRDEDIDIPSGDRWFYAKKKGADIYLSLRLRQQNRDCVQIYYAGHQAKAKANRKEVIIPLTPKKEVVLRESRRFSELLVKNLGNDSIAACGPAQTQKDVLFETADFPAVIMEFNITRSAKRQSYVVDPAHVELISRATASAIKEFMAGQPR